ncbi:magnesium protoporphyrin IX methyltransferase, chloroplastic-like [Hordeum vulgare subsp. vulgare]|uniref:magnesium protoporphyrin IX methyltransferase, chloroplastic-like n=1 Tax=Hordeum vulgare subsp. vulgare TaxID=112509 RepID=UPI001D1A4AB9|nr:magnesium protoporphyrin IX methyltransferase, chloroplastic-like [Hordeum vulgare subsp. vulgare]
MALAAISSSAFTSNARPSPPPRRCQMSRTSWGSPCRPRRPWLQLSLLRSPSPCHRLQLRIHQKRKPLTVASALPEVADLPWLPLSAAAATFVVVVSYSDLERRCKAHAEAVGGGDKEPVCTYFESTGFEWWRRIYDLATDDVNHVQLDIRKGHTQMVAATLAMLRDAPDVALSGATVCDARCGTWSLSIPLASSGASVLAPDISAAMVSKAERQAQAVASSPEFELLFKT